MTNKKEKIEQEEELKDVPEEVIENEIDAEKSPADEYLEGWKRCQADFENYKKRQAESQKDLLRYSTQNIVLQILPVIDNFHASTSHIPEEQKDNAWVTGIMYIQKQLEQVLVENGVMEIAVNVGDDFDPMIHEAVDDIKQTESEKKKVYFKNKIKKVVLNGYGIDDKIIRAARVVVE
ncbi:MAG: Protein GrpE [Candidatus Moranbacteria bacterium GW2011_GWA2_39_41]|nr:MAG: Protein GrpE [Candidatus Moranbacteria bacterium GW2011_GWA2_39_41]